VAVNVRDPVILGCRRLVSMIVGSLVLLEQHQTSDDHGHRILARQ
jgi:hypothetical protein